LTKVLEPRGILLRNDSSAREVEGLASVVEVARGEVPEQVPLCENGVRFLALPHTGQKTGWFYDHRDNRAQLARYAPGARVLDVFSYLGGWGVQAACLGAREVVCIDSSERALQGVADNAALNGVQEKVRTERGQSFELMKALVDAGERFDLVIVDPPAFIKRRKDLKSGTQAYHRLNELAMRLIARDGVVISASCSMHLAQEGLIEILRSSARHLDRHVQILGLGSQSADHPVHPAIPETAYLKCVFVRVAHQ
jgi:23S rRNA (cytosine1962-C5)-methyltransferase